MPAAHAGVDASVSDAEQRVITPKSLATDADSTCFNSVGQRKVLRVFVRHSRGRDIIDIPEGRTVAAIKQVIKDKYKIRVDTVQAGDINFERNTLVLAYAGAELDDNWVLSDMGISSGSTLHAFVKEEIDPVLYLHVGYNDETIPILDRLSLRGYPVATLRGIASRRSGLPVGVFRLTTAEGQELFDWHSLDAYGVNPGDSVNIETWDGWSELLQLAALGFSGRLMEKVSSSDDELASFQLRVALYIAAHFGHVELSTTLTRQKSIRCDQPVGQHPLKQWRTVQLHSDLKKAPIHEAVESGQLSVLRGFVHHNVCSIMVRDGNGLQPLNLALRQKQKQCASFLLTKQWSRISFGNSTVPLAIFARMKNWSERAKHHPAVLHSTDSKQQQQLSKRSNQRVRQHPLVGQGVYVDGYSQPQMNSSKRAPQPKQETELMRAMQRYYDSVYGDPEEHFFEVRRSMKLPKQLSKWQKMATNKEMDESDRLPPIGKAATAAAAAAVGTKQQKPMKAQRADDAASHHSSMKSQEAKEAASRSQPQQQQQQQKKQQAGSQQKRKPSISLLAKAKGGDNTIPLPLQSIDDTPRPFFHVRSGETNEVKQTLDRYYSNRGAGSRQYAIRCLSVAQSFKEKRWLHQVRLAMSFTEAGARKMTSSNSHNLLSSSMIAE